MKLLASGGNDHRGTDGLVGSGRSSGGTGGGAHGVGPRTHRVASGTGSGNRWGRGSGGILQVSVIVVDAVGVDDIIPILTYVPGVLTVDVVVVAIAYIAILTIAYIAILAIVYIAIPAVAYVAYIAILAATVYILAVLAVVLAILAASGKIP